MVVQGHHSPPFQSFRVVLFAPESPGTPPTERAPGLALESSRESTLDMLTTSLRRRLQQSRSRAVNERCDRPNAVGCGRSAAPDAQRMYTVASATVRVKASSRGAARWRSRPRWHRSRQLPLVACMQVCAPRGGGGGEGGRRQSELSFEHQPSGVQVKIP